MARRKDLYDRYLAEMQADPDDYRHGTVAGYMYGCRCDRCRKAQAEYYAESCRVRAIGEARQIMKGIRRYKRWLKLGGTPEGWREWHPL